MTVVKFGVTRGFLTVWGVDALNPSIVQGSTVQARKDRFYF